MNIFETVSEAFHNCLSYSAAARKSDNYVPRKIDRYVMCGWRVVSGSCVTIGNVVVLKTQSLKGGAPTVRDPFPIAPRSTSRNTAQPWEHA